MKLRQCKKCKEYTLEETHCNEKTIEAGYKYIKIKSSAVQKE
jgi:hypothetical protein